MYLHLNQVEILINEMIDYRGNISKKSEQFYRGRILKFFNEYMSKTENYNKLLDAITYHDINTYIENLCCKDTEASNIYMALKCFFTYTYSINKSSDIMLGVIKPIILKKEYKILCEKEYRLIKKFRSGYLACIMV